MPLSAKFTSALTSSATDENRRPAKATNASLAQTWGRSFFAIRRSLAMSSTDNTDTSSISRAGLRIASHGLAVANRSGQTSSRRRRAGCASQRAPWRPSPGRARTRRPLRVAFCRRANGGKRGAYAVRSVAVADAARGLPNGRAVAVWLLNWLPFGCRFHGQEVQFPAAK